MSNGEKDQLLGDVRTSLKHGDLANAEKGVSNVLQRDNALTNPQEKLEKLANDAIALERLGLSDSKLGSLGFPMPQLLEPMQAHRIKDAQIAENYLDVRLDNMTRLKGMVSHKDIANLKELEHGILEGDMSRTQKALSAMYDSLRDETSIPRRVDRILALNSEIKDQLGLSGLSYRYGQLSLNQITGRNMDNAAAGQQFEIQIPSTGPARALMQSKGSRGAELDDVQLAAQMHKLQDMATKHVRDGEGYE